MRQEVPEKLASGFNVAGFGALDDLLDDRAATVIHERPDGVRERPRLPFRPSARVAGRAFLERQDCISVALSNARTLNPEADAVKARRERAIGRPAGGGRP